MGEILQSTVVGALPLSYANKIKNRLFRKHLSGKITKGVIFVLFDGLIEVSQAMVA